MLPFADGIHLRVFFSPKALPRLLLPFIADRKASYGQDLSLGLRDITSPEQGRRKVIVEFSSPIIATEFDDKHLRSTIIGSFISNLYQCMGWEVVKLNSLGDWGKHIGLLAAGWARFGSEDALKAKGVEHLLDVYNQIEELFRPELVKSKKAKEDGQSTAEIECQGIFAERDAFFKKMEDGDETAVALGKRFRDIPIEDLTTS